ncbi:Chromatin remodeling protein EBS [Bienertia sinuspersici]
MVTRRLAQVSTSDDEGAPKPSSSDDETRPHQHRTGRRRRSRTSNRREPPPPPPKRRKKVQIPDDDEDEDDEEVANLDKDDDEEEQEEEEEEEEPVQEDAKPIGDVIRVSGKGRSQKKHYKEFEFDGNRFELEDPVLLTPEDKSQKPYVAIIKDITQLKNGNMMVTGQWFYRPEEADRKGGGSWQAQSVMHKCVVHFVPLHKQLPNRKQHPGFIVQKVYDTVEKKLWKLTDKDYEDGKQEEIDVLVQKTISRLGNFADIEAEDIPTVQLEELVRNKRMLRKRHISPLDVSREDEGMPKSPRMETPGSCVANASKYYSILAEAKALTRDKQRDKWLEKLLQGIEPVCSSTDNVQGEDKGTSGANVVKNSEEESIKSDSSFTWPDSGVAVVVALEKASHEAFFYLDFSKYNQKMRQLLFNLKGKLAQRLLSGELEPSKILNMTPTELKEGLTTEELARNQPEEAAKMQMTDALCKRCNERKVGLVDIIQAGPADRYQLECVLCGHTWYASRDEAAMLTIDGPSSVASVGTAPWATAKFESVEKKKLLSPRDTDKVDTPKKSIDGPMPTPETQKSFNKSKADGVISPKNPE